MTVSSIQHNDSTIMCIIKSSSHLFPLNSEVLRSIQDFWVFHMPLPPIPVVFLFFISWGLRRRTGVLGSWGGTSALLKLKTLTIWESCYSQEVEPCRGLRAQKHKPVGSGSRGSPALPGLSRGGGHTGYIDKGRQRWLGSFPTPACWAAPDKPDARRDALVTRC